jgi:DNA end-binding protein Ku
MPRAIWSGTVSFGLVSVPVRMFTAVSEHDLHFNLLHEPDGARIGYQKICKKEDEPVPDEEIVKAFEIEKGEFVPLTDEDFEAVKAELGGHAIEILDFVPYSDIDPIYFERTYYLGPQDGAEKVYALLREAMERSGLAAVARYVMRDREHLGAIRVRERTLTLERLFFADEIRPLDGIAPGKLKVDDRELKMATSLIEEFTGDWNPEQYKDDYRRRLLKVIRAKQRGETVRPPEEKAEEEPADLLSALRASVEAAKTERGRASSSRTRSRSSSRSRRAPSRKPSGRKRASSRR